jgi:hypothetical protein
VSASTRTGRPPNIDVAALPTIGEHPIKDVVADDTGPHTGNAGRVGTRSWLGTRVTGLLDINQGRGSMTVRWVGTFAVQSARRSVEQ